MRTTRDNWILLGVLAAIAAGFAMLAFMPQANRLDRIKDASAEVSRHLTAESAQAACLPALKGQVEESRRQLANYDRRLPKQKELAEFLRSITATVQTERLENQVIEPAAVSRGPLYNRLPISLKFTASSEGLITFLHHLDEMERLTRIERVRIRSAQEDGTSLRVELQINIYFTES